MHLYCKAERDIKLLIKFLSQKNIISKSEFYEIIKKADTEEEQARDDAWRNR